MLAHTHHMQVWYYQARKITSIPTKKFNARGKREEFLLSKCTLIEASIVTETYHFLGRVAGGYLFLPTLPPTFRSNATHLNCLLPLICI